MIVRRKRAINPVVTEASMPVSFNTADVREFFRLYCDLNKYQTWDIYRHECVMNEGDFRDWSENDFRVFGIFSAHWRVQLSGWLWHQLVKLGFLTRSTTDTLNYYFGPAAQKIVQKIAEEMSDYFGNE